MDEDILPKHHPLRQYLDELDLDEPFDGTPPMSRTANHTNVLETHVNNDKGNNFRFIFNFADKLRLHLSKTLLDGYPGYTFPDDDSNHPEKSLKISTFVFIHVTLIPVILLGLCQTSSIAFWWFSVAATCTMTLPLLAAGWLLLIYRRLKEIQQLITIDKARSRTCINFLQELHIRCTIDSADFDPDNPLHRLLLTLWYHLRLYNLQLLDLILNLKQLVPPDALLLCGISRDNLVFIREQLMDEDKKIMLSDCKMLRELATTLNIELFGQFYGIFCTIPVANFRAWIKLGLSVRRWSHVSQSLDRQLKRLNRTRSAIEYGQLCLNKGQLFAQADEAPNEDINPATLAARKLLLYLFTTVTKTQELLTLMNKNDHTSRPDDLAIILSYLKLQLESCQMCRSDLERLICGTDAACPEPTMDDSEATDSIDGLQNSSPAPVQVPPVDLIPEDDVVEDVATGHGDQPVGQDQIEALGSSMMPLHASVLNELRLVIAERRVEMQQREHVALQKRLRSSGSPHLTASTTELEQKTTSPVATESSGSQSPGIPISDDTLNRFFSSTTSTSSPRDTDARHGHPWSNRSAVSKRLQAFRRAHPTGDTADRQSGQCTDEHMPNPLSGSSFAASLLAQRRAIGYAEEDSFVAVGDGPEEDLISDVGNPDDGEPMNT